MGSHVSGELLELCCISDCSPKEEFSKSTHNSSCLFLAFKVMYTVRRLGVTPETTQRLQTLIPASVIVGVQEVLVWRLASSVSSRMSSCLPSSFHAEIPQKLFSELPRNCRRQKMKAIKC